MQLTPSAHVDTFCRDNLPPPEQWPEFLFDLPECSTRTGSTARSSCSTTSIAAARARPAVPARARGRAWTYGDLLAAAEPDRARAGRRPRRRARATGCCCAGRTTRGSSPAGSACSRPAAVVVTTMPLLRAGELRDDRTRSRKIDLALCDHRFLDDLRAPRSRRRCRWSRTAVRPTTTWAALARRAAGDVRRRRDRGRRRRAAGLHLRHDRPAQGDHALPPRRAGQRRHVLPPRAAADRGRRVHRHAAAGVHVRARRARGLPAARRAPRRCWSRRRRRTSSPT